MLKRCDNFGHLSLEDIANDSRLIPEIFHQELNYQNPQKSKEVFYEFVREYANLHNYKINETELGLKHQLILGFGLQNLVYLFSPTFVFDLFYVFGGSRGATIIPDISTNNREINVAYSIPKMLGKYYIRGDTKLHEYLHIYHFLLFLDMKKNNLDQNGFLRDNQRELLTQQRVYMVPDKNKLKEFERRIIRALQPKNLIQTLFSRNTLYAIFNVF